MDTQELLHNLGSLLNRHKGKTIHVFGAGPSLLNYAVKQDWSDSITIGINRVPLVIPCKYWIRCDAFRKGTSDDAQVEWARNNSSTFKILCKNIDPCGIKPDALCENFRVPCCPDNLKFGNLHWWGSSVHAAIELAGAMGASQIILWGIDYNNLDHAYKDDHKRPMWDMVKLSEKFRNIKDAWALRRVKIYNANANSLLKVFDFKQPVECYSNRKSDKLLITCLTTTGDRPWCLDQCKRYYKRALKNDKYDFKWVVVDDGVVPYDPRECVYVRNKPGGTFQQQVKLGIERCLELGAQHIIIMEDDDWYSPKWIQNHIDAFETGIKLHGRAMAMYYNAKERHYLEHGNMRHASLHSTAFSRELAIQFLKDFGAEGEDKNPLFDIIIWRKYGGQQIARLETGERMSVSMKGMPGRKGLSSGHVLSEADKKVWKPDPTGAILHKLIGDEDAKTILDKITEDSMPKAKAEDVFKQIIASGGKYIPEPTPEPVKTAEPVTVRRKIVVDQPIIKRRKIVVGV